MRALSALLFLVLAGSATAVAVESRDEPAAEASAVAAAGSFSFANSADGAPIFSASGIAPGDSASGSVEIANTGSEPGQLELTQHDLTEVPGSGGGKLSTRLTLRVTDVTTRMRPVTVYAGPLAPMPAQAAGQLRPGEARTYEFVATLPEAGPIGASAQNDVQGASTSVAFSWTTGEVTATSEPAPPAKPMPPESNPPAASPGLEPAPARLRLSITHTGRAVHHGRLLVWARCSTACGISARGHLRVRGAGARPARFRLPRRPGLLVGTRRLRIPVPHRLRRQLQAKPAGLRLIARVVLHAKSPAGETVSARRTLRVR